MGDYEDDFEDYGDDFEGYCPARRPHLCIPRAELDLIGLRRLFCPAAIMTPIFAFFPLQTSLMRTPERRRALNV